MDKEPIIEFMDGPRWQRFAMLVMVGFAGGFLLFPLVFG